MKKFISFLIIVGMILTGIGEASPDARAFAAKKESKITPSGLSYDEIGELMDQYVNEHKEQSANVAIAVFDQGETIYQRQYGYVDVENQISGNEDTVYEWASITKLLVWVSAMQLWEQGKLDLMEDIRGYLPKKIRSKFSYDEPITMTDLMNHQGGFQETTQELEVSTSQEIVDLETALIQTQPIQSYRPKTVTAYSNWGSALAAYVIEKITKEDFVTYVHKNIFEPLGMQHTSIGPDYTDTPFVAEKKKAGKCYRLDGEGLEKLEEVNHFIQIYPAGAATGTFGDFLRFAKALINENGKCPLFEKDSTLSYMKEATAYYGDSDIAKNCHGFWTMRYGVDVMGHNGNSYGGSTSFFFDPKTGLGIAVFTNVQQESTFCYGLAPIVFGECRMEEAPKKSEDISGIYLLSRFYTKGRFELLKYVGGLLRIPSCDENGVYPLGGPKDRIVPCGEHQYILQQGDYVRNLLYAQENEDGTKNLQMLSMDLIQEKKSTMIFHFITIGLFAVSVILSIVLSMIRLIRCLIRRIRRKEKMPSSSHRFWMEVQNVIVGGCAILSLIVPLVQGTFCGIGIQIAAVILGLDLGADDYMTKPFEPLELVAKVKSKIRRMDYDENKHTSEKICVRDLILNVNECILVHNQMEIPLTKTEFLILKLYMENPGHVFTKEHIYETGWGESGVVDDNTIRVIISRIREKLGDGYITTIRGLGYRLERE